MTMLPHRQMPVEDIHKEFQVFQTLTKMRLQTKDVPDNKQYLFILQEGLHCWESFPIGTPNNSDKEILDRKWEAFEGYFCQT